MTSRIRFQKGPGNYKYTAILPNGAHVNFGDRRYQHFRDKIGLWKSLDHLDKKRRANYRKRHSSIRNKAGKRAVDIKYSPAWFSYHYLW